MSIIINRYDLIPTAEDLPREFDEAVANALKSAPADSLDGDALGTLPETDSDVVGADFMRDLLESGGGLGERAEDDADSDFDLNDFDVALGEMIERLNSRAAKENLVMVRSDIFEDAGYIGVVCGVSRPETGKYYILGSDAHGRFPVVGFIFSPDTYRLAARANAKLEGFDFYGAHIDGDWQFTAADGALLQYAKFDTTSRLFSRNYGLLESGYMLQKRAVLVGCGSVGSHVALELARSGVGKFVLTDTDTLEIHNICRHQCGFDDLGRFKTDAVHDRILNINPDAEVVTFTSTIQDVPDGEWARLLGPDTIIIGGGDNRESSAYGCNLAAKYGSPFLSTCCWTRAHAGEIFYWLPDSGMICYSCAFNKLLSDARPESNHIYVGEDDVELLQQGRITFEPGVSVDINFVTDIALKLILDIINRDNGAYTPRVINYLRQYTFVCNTNETRVGGPRAAIFEHPLQVTRNLTLTSTPMPDCPYCAHAE